MPIFDYRCPACGHEFEELVSRPTEVIHCPCCRAVAHKQWSVFASPSGRDAGAAGDACACYPSGGG